jgi:hypothetical protein
MREEAMSNIRESDPSRVGGFRLEPSWLLVGLPAGGALVGALLALLGVGTWLVFASGALATFAVVGLVRPGAEAATSSLVRQADSGWGYLRTELARSRRHDRRFAVVGIPEDLWSDSMADPNAKSEAGLEVTAAVQGLVRRPDRAWVDGKLLHILLTDCDRPQGLAFLARARATLPQVFADERVKLVVFPDDGITSGALLAGLESSEIRTTSAEPSGQGAAR